jgi:transposase-like protein
MRMEVLAGPERRRRWSDEEKCRIVREAQEPGVRYADFARRHDISAAQLYQWRMALGEGRLIDFCGGSNGFLEVAGDAVDFAAPVEAPVIAMLIEIALPGGRALKAASSLTTAELKRLIRAVEDA